MTTERRLKPDPWKNEVYLRRGKRSLVSWQGWSNIPKEENDNHAPKKGDYKFGWNRISTEESRQCAGLLIPALCSADTGLSARALRTIVLLRKLLCWRIQSIYIEIF